MVDLIVSHIGTDIGDGSVGVQDHLFGGERRYSFTYSDGDMLVCVLKRAVQRFLFRRGIRKCLSRKAVKKIGVKRIQAFRGTAVSSPSPAFLHFFKFF